MKINLSTKLESNLIIMHGKHNYLNNRGLIPRFPHTDVTDECENIIMIVPS